MSVTNINKDRFKPDLIRSYWAATTVLLVGAVSGNELSYQLVVMLNIIQLIHFIYIEKSLTAFPVEVRATYLGLLIISQLPYMVWILWWQLIGTTAMVLFGYCFLARCLSLMPWNKAEDYSLDLFKRTFFTPPVKGSIIKELPVQAS